MCIYVCCALFLYIMLCTSLVLASGSVSQRWWPLPDTRIFTCAPLIPGDGNLTLLLQRSLVPRGLMKLKLKVDQLEKGRPSPNSSSTLSSSRPKIRVPSK
jgi:hypothetical protein